MVISCDLKRCNKEIGFKVQEDTYLYIQCSKVLGHDGPHYDNFLSDGYKTQVKESMDELYYDGQVEYEIKWWKSHNNAITRKQKTGKEPFKK